MDEADSLERALAYHERTKHHPGRYARGPGRLDWSTQPDPWRTYGADAPRIELPFPEPWARPALEALEALDALEALEALDAVSPAPLELATLSQLLERGLGITAWKEAGESRWALRANPSSGNLHPTEGWLFLPALAGLPGAGLYHYLSREHALEQRCALEAAAWESLTRGLPEGACLVALSSIPWREAWKYGERAWRYCQHDVGHALGALRYAAATLGWTLTWIATPADAELAALLGLDRGEHADVEAEQPDLIALLDPRGEARAPEPEWPDPGALAAVRAGRWRGRPSQLSPQHLRYEAIERAEVAMRKPRGAPPATPLPALPPPAHPNRADAIVTILRRRSAVDFDGVTRLPRAAFLALLEALLPAAGRPPCDALGAWRPRVHAVLAVHRVDDLDPGLYLLSRGGDAPLEALRAALRPEFLWETPPATPAHLPLRLLARGDLREAAMIVSCQQEIARDGAFALGFLAELGPTLRELGPWAWRALHHEAGLAGQALYLQAEAAGIRATGIGCFFDDLQHELLGLSGDAWHTIYHFAAGGPVEDTRVSTLPAYPRART